MNGALKSRVSREHGEVTQLETETQDPEPWVGHAQQRKRAQTDPVRRHEHAERTRVQRRPKVVEEPLLLRHRRCCTLSVRKQPDQPGRRTRQSVQSPDNTSPAVQVFAASAKRAVSGVSRRHRHLRLHRVRNKALLVRRVMQLRRLFRCGTLVAAVDNRRRKRHLASPTSGRFRSWSARRRFVDVAVETNPCFEQGTNTSACDSWRWTRRTLPRDRHRPDSIRQRHRCR